MRGGDLAGTLVFWRESGIFAIWAFPARLSRGSLAHFSAGDLMMVHVLLRLRPSGLLDEFPNLAAFVARGEARPAYQRAFAAQLAINAA